MNNAAYSDDSDALAHTVGIMVEITAIGPFKGRLFGRVGSNCKLPKRKIPPARERALG